MMLVMNNYFRIERKQNTKAVSMETACAHTHTPSHPADSYQPKKTQPAIQTHRSLSTWQGLGGYENDSAVFISVQVNITGWLLLKAEKKVKIMLRSG